MNCERGHIHSNHTFLHLRNLLSQSISLLKFSKQLSFGAKKVSTKLEFFLFYSIISLSDNFPILSAGSQCTSEYPHHKSKTY